MKNPIKVRSLRILEIEAFGLKNYWESNYVPQPKRCLIASRAGTAVQKTRPISLIDLKATFALFAAGSCLGIVASFIELVSKYWRHN